MNKNKEALHVLCSNMYHLLGLRPIDSLGVYSYELCPDFHPSSFLHPPRGVMSFHSPGAKPECAAMSFC